MEYKHKFEMLTIGNEKYDNPNYCYHDDYYEDGIEVKDFFGKDIFGDFRLFNGVRLKDMDDALVKISQALTEMDQKRVRGEG